MHSNFYGCLLPSPAVARKRGKREKTWNVAWILALPFKIGKTDAPLVTGRLHKDGVCSRNLTANNVGTVLSPLNKDHLSTLNPLNRLTQMSIR